MRSPMRVIKISILTVHYWKCQKIIKVIRDMQENRLMWWNTKISLKLQLWTKHQWRFKQTNSNLLLHLNHSRTMFLRKNNQKTLKMKSKTLKWNTPIIFTIKIWMWKTTSCSNLHPWGKKLQCRAISQALRLKSHRKRWRSSSRAVLIKNKVFKACHSITKEWMSIPGNRFLHQQQII